MTATQAAPIDALVAIAWSRVWSPIVPQPLFTAAWNALALPTDRALCDAIFFSTFHTGFPTPTAPLLLHVALNRSGDAVRMDMLRAMSHLGIKAGDHMLAPDHLAIVCEVLAAALAADETVIVSEICRRYLVPWCDSTHVRLKGTDQRLSDIVLAFRTFADDLAAQAVLPLATELPLTAP